MIVSSLIAQTGKSVDSPQEFALVMEGRVQALSRVHGLLNQHNQVHAVLRDIIVGELDAYRSAAQQNIVLDGPEAVYLTPKATQILALALHELATNAAKYGALSSPSGKVAVNWRVANSTQDPHLSIEWMESDGPRVKMPARRGFGSKLIERVVNYELQAQVQRDFPPQGVRCTIEFSLTDRTGYALAAAKHEGR